MCITKEEKLGRRILCQSRQPGLLSVKVRVELVCQIRLSESTVFSDVLSLRSYGSVINFELKVWVLEG